VAYLNVYQSGYYHRRGKPGQYNCHPGDLYPTYDGAVEDVDPSARHLYLGTFEVNIPAALLGPCNPPDSVPVPLSQTRRELRLPSQVVGMRPLKDNWVGTGSLETSEREANELSTEQIVSRWGNGEAGR
jgi:hypothetical protein